MKHFQKLFSLFFLTLLFVTACSKQGNTAATATVNGDEFLQSTPTNESPSPSFDFANNIILYTTISTPSNKKAPYWALRTLPNLSFLPPSVFEVFYGEVGHADDIGLYSFNFRPQPSPNGRFITLPGIGGYTNPNGDLGTGLWLADLQAQIARQLLPQAKIITWSPESDQITYIDNDTLYVLAIEEGASPIPLFTHPQLNGLYARWSPDGNWIAVVTTTLSHQDGATEADIEDTYWLIPTSGSEPKLLTKKPGFAMEHVADEITWSDNSQFILLRGRNEAFNLAGEQVSPPLTGAAHWQPGETQLLINGRTGGLSLMTVDGVEISVISDKFAPKWAFSHDGQQLAYTQETDTHQIDIFVFDLKNNQSRFINVVTEPYIDLLRWSYGDDYLIFEAGQTIWAVAPQPNSALKRIVEDGTLIEIVPQPTR